MLSEQIFINKQFLEDLNSICDITLCKFYLSNWGFNTQDKLSNIDSYDYILGRIWSTGQNTIADTIIEDDLVCITLPESINYNNYYSIVLFYDKKSASDFEPLTQIACIMYTQKSINTMVLPLVNFAENRIYLDLRGLPLKAHLKTFLSPYEQQQDLATGLHAPTYHKHITRPSNMSSDNSSFSNNSCLPNSYTDSLAVTAAISATTELSPQLIDDKLNDDGQISNNYLSDEQNATEFFTNKVGCAYEWAHSRLCTEDLVDAQHMVLISDISVPMNE